jgi:hypothetical protein
MSQVVYQIGKVIEKFDSDEDSEEIPEEVSGDTSDCIDFDLYDKGINEITEGLNMEYHPILSNENLGSDGNFDKINLISNDRLLLDIKDEGNIVSGYSYGTAQISSSKEIGPVEISTTIKGLGNEETVINIINTLKHDKTSIFSPTGPSTILFDKNGNFDLFLIAHDSKNRPTFVENEERFLLSPVNDIIKIQKDQTFAHANFHSDSFGTDTEDSIILNAVPIGISADKNLEAESIFDREPSSSLKMVFPYNEFDVRSDLQYTGIVQLIDLRGNPLGSSSLVKVKIESENSDLIDIPRFVDIQAGNSYAEFPIKVNGKKGSVSLSAHANGVIGSEASLSIKSFLNKLSVSTSVIEEPITPGESLEVKIYVDSEELEPISGVELHIKNDGNSTILPASIKTQDDGSAKIHLTAGNEPTLSFQVFATAEGYVEEQKSFEFTVDAVQIQSEEALVLGLPEWVLYVGLAAIVVIVAAIGVFLKKPKQSLEDEEEEIFEEDI